MRTVLSDDLFFHIIRNADTILLNNNYGLSGFLME